MRSRCQNLLPVVSVLIAIVLASNAEVRADQPQPQVNAKLKDLNDHFPMVVPETLDQWKSRATDLSLQVRVSLAVHPMPTISDAEPTVHGRREMDGYSIEKIYFESLPGFYVTGSLYRPRGIAVPKNGYPAVMYAHGHWENGRFYEAPPNEVRQLLATGAERFEHAAINQLQAACVQLARMGCIVLQYDMIGYADSQQISFDRAHRFGMNVENPGGEPGQWLLYSAKAEGYGQSIMALQTINGLRAFELLRSMPDVDGNRIAITGASGGGTQSLITAATEPRLAGAFPAVMVSTGMQGGCTCENACGLRVGTGNVEIVSLAAPRPVGMTTAKDWTLTMPEDGFPQLKQLFGLFGKEAAVQLYPGPQFPHNYNHVSRVAMYGFMNRLFGLGLAEPILEADFDLIKKDELTVWDSKHLAPESGIEYERKLTAQWAAIMNSATAIRASDSAESKAKTTAILREGWQAITSPAVSLATTLTIETSGDTITIVGNRKSVRQPSVNVNSVPSKATSGTIDLLIEPVENALHAKSRSNSNKVYVCNLIDPLGGDDERQSLVSNPRPAAAYTYGYNAPRIIRKLAVLLRLIEETKREQNKSIRLVVTPSNTFLAAAAVLVLNDGKEHAIQQVIVEGPREEAVGVFSNVDSIVHNDFLPGSLRYQGLEGLLSVIDSKLFVFQ